MKLDSDGAGRVERWIRRHNKSVSAVVFTIGGVSFIGLIIGAASGSDSLNRVAGAMALILIFWLIVYAVIKATKGLVHGIALASPVLVQLALFLLGLFALIWIIKRMWEAA